MSRIVYESRDYLFADHGLKDSNPEEAKQFFYHHNTISFIIMIVAILTAQFIFETLNQILIKYVSTNYILSLFISTIIVIILLIILTKYIFKVPIAAAFTY